MLLLIDEASFCEELAQALLVDRLAQEVVHARFFCLLLVFLSLVCSYTADEGLGLFGHVLVQVLFYSHASFNASTLWHAIVEKNELVRVALSAISLFHPVDSLIAV